jgi:hypothetical protein
MDVCEMDVIKKKEEKRREKNVQIKLYVFF